ncbi:MAG: hypothetical protein KAI47_23010, partial [Deltaproteobacteria bacterium]|nr:hypothetical protein [Deltaproteobacteria bacterium]
MSRLNPTKSMFLLASAMAFPLLTFPIQVEAISRRGASALRNVLMTLRNIKKDPKLFDGKSIVAGARMDRIKNYLARSQSNLNRAIRGYNRISAADRGDPAARQAGQQLNDLSKYFKALDKAFKNQSAAGAGADKTCREFEKEAMTLANRKVMRSMVLLLKDPGAVQLPRASIIQNWKAVAVAVKAICDKPEYKNVGKVGCRGMKLGKRQRDPSAWCEAAQTWKKLVQGAVMNRIKHHTKVFSNVGPNANKLQSSEGYMQFEGPVTYKEHMYFGKKAKAKVLGKLKPLLDAAGINSVGNAELFAKFKAAKDALRAKVDELAPTWKSKPNKGKDRSCAMAKRHIKRWHPRASIKKVYLRSAAWNIRKNALGVPLERSKPGIIIFKLPGEKWCQ